MRVRQARGCPGAGPRGIFAGIMQRPLALSRSPAPMYHRVAPSLLVAAILLLAGCAVARGAGSASASATTAPASMRVLVYNIHAGKDAAGVDNLARVADVIRETRADVVLLQEVDRGTRRSGGVDQPADLERRTGFTAVFGKSLDYDGGEYGIAILSRWPVTRDTVLPLPVEPPQKRSGGAMEPRAALVATVRAPGGDVTVVNTHLDASRVETWRRQEVQRVAAATATLRTTRARVLVGGDFNSEPGSGAQEDARQGGLRDAWTMCGRGDALTYPADSAVKRIDYLYLTGDASCTEAMVPRTTASDHRPLVVQVNWP